MEMVQPTTWDEALAAKAAATDLLPIAGGTDVMVELNFDRRRPAGLLDLTRVPELAEWSVHDGTVTLGAGVTYAEVVADLAGLLPGLALAARTVGSPQIRNRGTVGGNLGSASPAGDAHPPLLAADAVVEVASVHGTRRVPVAEFFTGVKRNALAPEELIRCVHVPSATGPQQFSKIGTRNAMVIAVASFALVLDPAARRVGTGIGSAAPTPRRAVDAEVQLAGELAAGGCWESREPPAAAVVARFAELVAAAASPIDDVRGTAAYRRHALAVMARRTLTWAWADYRREAAA
jgi:CO/xanthine dehydrogenase FAD-binding subunit